jgi:hypothetical protein
MMNDENTEEKRPEEEKPQKPWLLRQLERIQNAIKEGKDFDEIRPPLEQLFDEITPERYSFTDKESQEYLLFMSKRLQKLFKEETIELTPYYLNRQEKFLPLWKIAHSPFASEIWKLWWEKAKAKGEDNRQLLDSLALDIFILAEKNTLESICDERWYDGDFHNLARLAASIYADAPSTLDKIGIVLEKIDSKAPELADAGKSFRARAQALWVKEELKEETKDEVRAIVSEETKKFSEEIKKETNSSLDTLKQELDEGLDVAKENEQRMIRNFVQIIGIFAAIIAFIVTIVPTAARLGGASIPIALAGLAIVTAGIIILLAMIFGREEKEERRRALRKGFWGAIGAFGAWLILGSDRRIWGLAYSNIDSRIRSAECPQTTS